MELDRVAALPRAKPADGRFCHLLAPVRSEPLYRMVRGRDELALVRPGGVHKREQSIQLRFGRLKFVNLVEEDQRAISGFSCEFNFPGSKSWRSDVRVLSLLVAKLPCEDVVEEPRRVYAEDGAGDGGEGTVASCGGPLTMRRCCSAVARCVLPQSPSPVIKKSRPDGPART